MLLLVSGSTRMVRQAAGKFPGLVGHLLAPGNGNRYSYLNTGLSWGFDNGGYRGFDPLPWRRLLTWVSNHSERCLWTVCPDKVADAQETLRMFEEYAPEIEALRLPVAFVGQNGQESLTLPWDRFACLFLGGTPECRRCRFVASNQEEFCPSCGGRLREWKLSAAAHGLAVEAKRRGKLLHMGRVNSLRRLRIAHSWGCDSVDGSGYSRFAAVAERNRPDMKLERHLDYLRGLHVHATEQLTFWE